MLNIIPFAFLYYLMFLAVTIEIIHTCRQGAAALTKKDPMLISCVNSSLNLNMNILYFKNYLVESYGQITKHF